MFYQKLTRVLHLAMVCAILSGCHAPTVKRNGSRSLADGASFSGDRKIATLASSGDGGSRYVGLFGISAAGDLWERPQELAQLKTLNPKLYAVMRQQETDLKIQKGRAVCGKPTGTCRSGSPYQFTDFGSYATWSCAGARGSVDDCTTLKAIDGGCGKAAASTCDAGTAGNVSVSGLTTTWTCFGQNHGQDAPGCKFTGTPLAARPGISSAAVTFSGTGTLLDLSGANFSASRNTATVVCGDIYARFSSPTVAIQAASPSHLQLQIPNVSLQSFCQITVVSDGLSTASPFGVLVSPPVAAAPALTITGTPWDYGLLGDRRMVEISGTGFAGANDVVTISDCDSAGDYAVGGVAGELDTSTVIHVALRGADHDETCRASVKRPDRSASPPSPGFTLRALPGSSGSGSPVIRGQPYDYGNIGSYRFIEISGSGFSGQGNRVELSGCAALAKSYDLVSVPGEVDSATVIHLAVPGQTAQVNGCQAVVVRADGARSQPSAAFSVSPLPVASAFPVINGTPWDYGSIGEFRYVEISGSGFAGAGDQVSLTGASCSVAGVYDLVSVPGEVDSPTLIHFAVRAPSSPATCQVSVIKYHGTQSPPSAPFQINGR